MPSTKPVILPLFIPFEGCPHRCVFCDQKAITGRSSGESPSRYGRIIEDMLGSMKSGPRGPVEIAFYGGSFTALPEKRQTGLLEQALPFIRSGRVHGIRISTRPDCIDVNTLSLLKRYGVATIELGVQSLDDEVLEKSGRGHGAGDSPKAAGLVKSGGFKLGLQMMTGLPGDSLAASLRTALGLAELSPDFVRIYPAVVIEGTPMAGMWRTGEYRPWDLAETIEALSLILPMFRSRRIPVARIGLLLDAELLSRRRVLAGPVHPSIGSLAMTSVARNSLIRCLSGEKRAMSAVRVNPGEVSIFTGEGKRTLLEIREAARDPLIRIIPDPSVPRGFFLPERG